MEDYLDYMDDAILPDDFDPTADEYDFNAEPAESTPTTEDDYAETSDAEDGYSGDEDTTPEPAMPSTIKVKFNHEEREIGLEEAAPLIQKGMNYDKMESRMKELEAISSRSARLATDLGYENAEEMFKAAEENNVNRQIQELIDEGNTEAMARFLVEQRRQQAVYTEPQPQEPPTPEEKPMFASLDDNRRAELDEFVKAYPGVTQLPDEVIQANMNGTRLLVAYERYQNKSAQKELAILKQNQAAAAKAPVSGVTGKLAPSGKSAEDDPFMKGFDSDAW